MTKLFELREYLQDTKNDWNYITPTGFYNEYYVKNKDFILIDLRKSEDYDKFHIKRSINIFWLDILKKENLDKLPIDKILFLICYVGHTSSQVIVLLKLLGYTVVSIKFGYGISPSFGVPVENLPAITSECKSAY